ncbi:hypothetical protein ACFW04_013956 [Cataglyphis niger]
MKSKKILLNPTKCSFFKREIKYLGHVVSQQGVTTDPEKISTFQILLRIGSSYQKADLADDYESWRKDQLDPVLVKILRGRKKNQRPSWQEIISGNSSTKIYWKWESLNLRTCLFQTVVPQKRIKEILEKVHDSPLDGLFGVNKILEKIQKRFYWATFKEDVEDCYRSCKICISKKGPFDKERSEQIYNHKNKIVHLDRLASHHKTPLNICHFKIK